MDASKESTSFINEGVFAILPEEELFSHKVSHPIPRNIKWSFLAFTELIFVTNITIYICGGKVIMRRNFGKILEICRIFGKF